MKKPSREEKLNNLWRYLQKTKEDKILLELSKSAILYSLGVLTQEQALTRLIIAYFNLKVTRYEIKKLEDIIEGRNNG